MWSLIRRKPRQKNTLRRTSLSIRPRLEALEDRCLLSAPGTLDPTFGSGGTVTTAITKANDVANGVLLQSNGDIIAYGGSSGLSGSNVFELARYTPSGSLDTTFGSGGIVTTKFGGVGDTISHAALQSDGKIVAAATNGHLVRYNSDGSLDKTFGSKGIVTYPTVYDGSSGAVVIQPINGSEYIVVGSSTKVGNDTAIALLHYTPSGTLDPTFGNGGEVVTDIPGTGAYDNYLALENSNIVAGGFDTSNGHVWLLARYTLNGSLDSTFGNGGIVASSINGQGGEAFGSALQSNGEIVVAGFDNFDLPYYFEVGVYTSTGSPDTSFGSAGFVNQTFNSGAQATGVVVQPTDGKIVAAGDTIFGNPTPGTAGSKEDFFLARYIGTTTPLTATALAVSAAPNSTSPSGTSPATPPAASSSLASSTLVTDSVLANLTAAPSAPSAPVTASDGASSNGSSWSAFQATVLGTIERDISQWEETMTKELASLTQTIDRLFTDWEQMVPDSLAANPTLLH
jgi:uncharacterized delta-60 repeat protein